MVRCLVGLQSRRPALGAVRTGASCEREKNVYGGSDTRNELIELLQ